MQVFKHEKVCTERLHHFLFPLKIVCFFFSLMYFFCWLTHIYFWIDSWFNKMFHQLIDRLICLGVWTGVYLFAYFSLTHTHPLWYYSFVWLFIRRLCTILSFFLQRTCIARPRASTKWKKTCTRPFSQFSRFCPTLIHSIFHFHKSNIEKIIVLRLNISSEHTIYAKDDWCIFIFMFFSLSLSPLLFLFRVKLFTFEFPTDSKRHAAVYRNKSINNKCMGKRASAMWFTTKTNGRKKNCALCVFLHQFQNNFHIYRAMHSSRDEQCWNNMEHIYMYEMKAHMRHAMTHHIVWSKHTRK